MADLRLVGVHDDGRHLLLSGPDGDIYLLPLDEALRTAVGKTAHRSARVPQASGSRMTPREIQTLIRSGSTAADISEQSGLSLEQIRRYEGPVLAEREFMATQARKVEVAAATAHNDGYKSAFGDSPATLDEMVQHRLAAFGIDPKTLRWDAWRDSASAWTISADFDPGTAWAANSIGQPAPALWRFHPGRKALHNANRWAQQLSELEPLDSPVPERRLSAVMDKPFDVEADLSGGEPATADLTAGAPAANPVSVAPDAAGVPDSAGVPDPADADEDYPGHRGLLDMLRSRRGVRLGINEVGDDELAAMLGTHIPGAHPRDEALYGTPTDRPASGAPAADADAANTAAADAAAENDVADGTEGGTPEARTSAEVPAARDRLRSIPFLKLAPRLAAGEPHLSGVDSVAEVSTETREIVLSGEPASPLRPARPLGEPAHQVTGDHDDAPSDSEVAARLERKAAAKPKRSSVPSWDEIVFGTKGD